MQPPPRSFSSSSPLAYEAFRAIWIAAIFSNVGTFVQDVGESWLMLSLTRDPLPVAIHADRVIGRWNPRTVSWSTAPPVEDVRLPRTVIASTTPSLVRVDVTDLVRLWLAHDPRDQGLSIVAENETATGVTFTLGGTSLPDPKETSPGKSDLSQPPRLEVYVR